MNDIIYHKQNKPKIDTLKEYLWFDYFYTARDATPPAGYKLRVTVEPQMKIYERITVKSLEIN